MLDHDLTTSRVKNEGLSRTQLRLPKAAELLAGTLRGQIVRGELREGDTLPPEGDLMERFGVSRPTLREALRVLEAESLLRIRRGSRGGAVVTSPDPRVAARVVGVLLQLNGVTLADIHEVRTMIEPMAARRIAGHKSAPRVAAELRVINDDLKANVEDFSVFPQISWRFHRTLVESAGNRTMGVLIQMIADIVQMQLARQYERSRSEVEVADQIRANTKSARANDRLLRYLEDRDADAAEAFWERHLMAVGDHLLGPDRDQVIDLPG